MGCLKYMIPLDGVGMMVQEGTCNTCTVWLINGKYLGIDNTY